ncbi:MAG: hypothetical protein LBE04_01850 [Prevotellaceae bacterium]|jgi:hypothetical protein|nr:hypothetical protein [Prevotellaceae bacterium]
MRTKRTSFTGHRPIFTGSPSIVQGGFNLDTVSQKFNVDDVIPGGTLAIYDEQSRLVKIIKTAKVMEINVNDTKIVSLHVDEFYEPVFAVGDKVLVNVTGKFTDAPSITKIEKGKGTYVVTLSAAISGLAAENILVEVIAGKTVTPPSGSAYVEADFRGNANAVTLRDYTVGEYETAVDVCADTMQYMLYERRVPPIPVAQKDSTGNFLLANPHVKLSKSF